MSRAGPVLKDLPRRSSPLDPWRYPRRERTEFVRIIFNNGERLESCLCLWGNYERA